MRILEIVDKIVIHLRPAHPVSDLSCAWLHVQGLSPVDPYVIAALLVILKELLEILISSKHLFLVISAKCGLCHGTSGVAQ